jgi:ATP-binding cassette subfamily F protein uup
VSHDRAFLDNVVTQVIAFEGDGKLAEYVGGYTDWQRQRAPEVSPEKSIASAKVRAPRPPSRVKLTFKETRELESVPAKIAALETEQKKVGERLADSELYRTQPNEVKRLRERFSEIETELMTALARWEELEAKRSAG